MIKTFKDSASIIRINPEELSCYLENNGWINLQTKKNYIKIFQRKENNKLKAQVIVPMEKGLIDYSESLQEALINIASVEKRSYEDLINSLLSYTSDTIKIRLNRSSVLPGNIMMEDAVNIFSNIKRLLEITAMDLSDYKRVHKGRNTKNVQKFIQSCRFGQTEVGSYIITVICPLSKGDVVNGEQGSLLSDEDLYSNSMARQITDRVMQTIYRIKRHFDCNQDIFDKTSVDYYPISANFVETLSRLSLNNDDAELEFIVDWAPIAKKPSNYTNRISMSHIYYSKLCDLSKQIKTEKKIELDVRGKVIKLESELNSDKNPYGKITVSYGAKRKYNRKLAISVDKSTYSDAVSAHFNGLKVHVKACETENGDFICKDFEIEDGQL